MSSLLEGLGCCEALDVTESLGYDAMMMSSVFARLEIMPSLCASHAYEESVHNNSSHAGRADPCCHGPVCHKS